MRCASVGPFFDVIMLGIAFFLIFTAFQSCGMIQGKVLQEFANVTKTNSSSRSIKHNSGYISLGVIYVFVTLANLIAAPIVNFLGPRLSMFFGGTTYVLYVASYLRISGVFLYVTSAILGCGAALLWTAQGNFLTLSSDKETMARNSGVFWAMLQCSFLVGSAFLYGVFRGKLHIDADMRLTVYIVFSVVAVLGTLMMLALRKPRRLGKCHVSMEMHVEFEQSSAVATNVVVNDRWQTSMFRQNTAKLFLLFVDTRMMLLSIALIYNGLVLTFLSGVYGTALANTKYFQTNANSMIGLSGMFIGVGEVLGGSMFGLFQSKTSKFGRGQIVFLGSIVHVVCFLIIFINIPEQSPMKETDDFSYIIPNKSLGIFCSFLLGFGDSCWNTQTFAILGSVWHEDSAPAFAFFRLCQGLSAAVGFFYSPYLGLRWQLLILVIFGTGGAFAYFIVNRNAERAQALMKATEKIEL